MDPNQQSEIPLKRPRRSRRKAKIDFKDPDFLTDEEDDEAYDPNNKMEEITQVFEKPKTRTRRTRNSTQKTQNIQKVPKKTTNTTISGTKKNTKIKKESIEHCTIRILRLLQKRGKMVFKDIFTELGIGYRRAYDILNVLLTTPLVHKPGKKRESKMPYIYLDGEPLPEVVDVVNILEQIEYEESQINVLTNYVNRLEEELGKNEPCKETFTLIDLENLDEETTREYSKIEKTDALDPIVEYHREIVWNELFVFLTLIAILFIIGFFVVACKNQSESYKNKLVPASN
ncbi:transcription factor e2f6 [Anaeramoeba flamelloides]|uniref:Transcription factor e2f6 n=1 Tax=Anaeramoeba flamelloides TaxID=1746091 RepID=A0AAV7YPF5_9EUKA|nr:transcription factor e2f6 [Anaeramoeba flamelloides]